MGVAGQRKVGKVFERFAAPVSCELSASCEPAENLCDFDVQNVRGTQRFIGREESRRALLTSGRSEKHLNDGGCVDDGHLESRSLRRASVGVSERLALLLDSRRCRSSATVGRSATACIWVRR